MHDRISVHNLCFPDASLATMAGYWRELGARRISFTSGQVVDEDPAEVRALVAGCGARVETITHVFEPGPLPLDEDGVCKARARLSRVIDVAEAVGARSIYMLTGGRGAMNWEQAADTFSTAIAPCVAQAEAAGVALAIENAPFLYADVHIAHTLRDTATLARIAGIGVCIDLFGCWTEAGLAPVMTDAMPLCRLIQISDHVPGDRSLPARAVPGDGAIPLRHLIATALDAGYVGTFDLELVGPRIDSEGRLEAMRRAGANLGQMLTELGA